MITVFFFKKGKSVTSRVLRKTRTLYNWVSTSEKPEHTRKFSFPLSLLSLSRTSLFFSLSFPSSLSSFPLLFPFSPPVSSHSGELRRYPADAPRRDPGARPRRGTGARRTQARPRPAGRHQPRPDPAQSRPPAPTHLADSSYASSLARGNLVSSTISSISPVDL